MGLGHQDRHKLAALGEVPITSIVEKLANLGRCGQTDARRGNSHGTDLVGT